MKQYNRPKLAYEAARRHVARHGGSAAVVETMDLPGTYHVGTLYEVRQLASCVKVVTCRLFYGITGRRYQQRRPHGANPIIEMDTALLCERGT